ncbi:MAG: sigma-70 family RNA polymerase sigma factor [Bacteroidota bacterium]
MSENQTIDLYTPMLQAIAMKIVGSMADAEDIVQDTFLKWLSAKEQKIQNTRSYLIKAVTNNSINHLNALKRKKDECLENISHSDLIEWYRDTDFAKFDLENEVSEALNVIHKKLEPVEKGVYILREVFNMEYEELQDIFDKKKENCRQLFSRAKEKLNKGTSKIKFDLNPPAFLENFKKACDLGHASEFVHELKGEIHHKLKDKK